MGNAKKSIPNNIVTTLYKSLIWTTIGEITNVTPEQKIANVIKITGNNIIDVDMPVPVIITMTNSNAIDINSVTKFTAIFANTIISSNVKALFCFRFTNIVNELTKILYKGES